MSSDQDDASCGSRSSRLATDKTRRSLPAQAVVWPGDFPRQPPPRMRQAPAGGTFTASTFAFSATLAVVVGAGCAVVLLGQAHARSHEKVLRASCENNLKQIGVALRKYAREHDGEWPDVKYAIGALQPDWTLLRELDASFNLVLTCPAERGGAECSSYFYLGYEIIDEKAAETFVAAMSARAVEGGAFNDDLSVPESEGIGVVRKLREHVETDADSARCERIPVVIERATNHLWDGMHVLYKDGHVEYIKFGTRFPATRRALRSLGTLDAEFYPSSTLRPARIVRWDRDYVWLGPKN